MAKLADAVGVETRWGWVQVPSFKQESNPLLVRAQPYSPEPSVRKLCNTGVKWSLSENRLVVQVDKHLVVQSLESLKEQRIFEADHSKKGVTTVKPLR